MVFRALDSEGRGYLIRDEIVDHIDASGTRFHGQIESLVQTLESKRRHYNDPIHFQEFEQLLAGRTFTKKIFENSLIIPQFQMFKQNFKQTFEEIKAEEKYQVG